jgi:radical SAM protein with 4Fe4S-binding SPASM domain
MPIDFTYEVEWTKDDLAALKKELELFGTYYKRWMAEGKPVFSMFIRDANLAQTQAIRPWCDRCGLGNRSLGVDYDGTLYPCHRFIDSHKIRIGDIYKGYNAAYKQWNEAWQRIAPYCEEPKKCLSCNYKKACSGGCIAMNYDIFESPHVNPEIFCTIKQLIVITLGDLCKSLQSNPTFQKQYQNNNQKQPNTAQQHKPCGCQGKANAPPPLTAKQPPAQAVKATDSNTNKAEQKPKSPEPAQK